MRTIAVKYFFVQEVLPAIKIGSRGISTDEGSYSVGVYQRAPEGYVDQDIWDGSNGFNPFYVPVGLDIPSGYRLIARNGHVICMPHTVNAPDASIYLDWITIQKDGEVKINGINITYKNGQSLHIERRMKLLPISCDDQQWFIERGIDTECTNPPL